MYYHGDALKDKKYVLAHRDWKDHKYISKEKKNGEWRYKYEKAVGDLVRAQKKRVKLNNQKKELRKYFNDALSANNYKLYDELVSIHNYKGEGTEEEVRVAMEKEKQLIRSIDKKKADELYSIADARTGKLYVDKEIEKIRKQAIEAKKQMTKEETNEANKELRKTLNGRR